MPFTPFDRAIIVALDSVTWDLLLPFAADGTMNALASYLKSANHGVLESTVPPHTAAAWTTFLTGKDPGRHGVIDFVKFDPVKHKFRFHDSSVQRAENIFTRLSEADIACGSIFLPRCYPPYPLKFGYMVSGFETPGTACDFTDPGELRDEVLGISPNLHFNFEDDWEDDGTDEAFSHNIDRAILSVDLLERLAVHFQRERPVKLQVAYLQATDILFHKAWRWCDPKTAGGNEFRRETIKKFFRRVDQMLNRILGLHSSSSTSQRFRPDSSRLLRLIVSDHGHGSSNGRVFVNNFLKDWGYLTPLGGISSVTRRLAMLTMDAEQRRVKNRELGLNWQRTKAYLAHVGIYGFVYVNLRGREPDGIVAPEDFESVRSELIAKFMAEKIPGTDRPLFVKVHKGEELYARKKELNLPDLVVVPADGFYPRKKLSRGPAVRLSPNAVGGVHRPDGVYAFQGPGIVSTNELGPRAGIADIAPTLLAAFGQPIPRSMTGQVMAHIFKDPPEVSYIEDSPEPAAPAPKPVYSAEEESAIEKRLADLGYLE